MKTTKIPKKIRANSVPSTILQLDLTILLVEQEEERRRYLTEVAVNFDGGGNSDGDDVELRQRWRTLTMAATEETKKADKSPALEIITAVSLSGLVGRGYLISITYAVTNIPYLLSLDDDAAGYAIARVFDLAFNNR
ncbi:uncharacterized protein A4U43_C09F8830 [Asparagus officinalis]|uniref:Uncharacterized protein n=1 Tax=Asparagus officinalis TaxID=4686 RepID=A0A5P1E6I1_ASPOF|nr:uncharacterized protein A4U43_C09F8830 [Asparagus officinalis]